MKTLLKLPIFILYLGVLVACSEDSSREFQGPADNEAANMAAGTIDGVPGVNAMVSSNVYFGFLDGEGSSNTPIDMLAESSENLLVGRWKITRMEVDENNDGKIRTYNYGDFRHGDCGRSFLQFNSDRVVFENCYNRDERGICTLFAETSHWELTEDNRLQIYVYNNIHLIKVTESQLVLKYDWNFENSLYGPAQVYYYYDRVPLKI